MIRSQEIDPERQSASGVAAGERALMLAVLEDAIRALAGDSGPARTRIERATEARAWFEERGSRWPFAFDLKAGAAVSEQKETRSTRNEM